MDADLKAKWVEALRSGKYGKGQGRLHDERDGTYCCLGVLCKVLGADFDDATDEEKFLEYDHVPVLNGRVLSHRDDEELEEAFCVEIGLPDQGTLIAMNDDQEKSFAEIADYIEREIPVETESKP
jgi:hypothetical protein